jgi:hypothetical protein
LPPDADDASTIVLTGLTTSGPALFSSSAHPVRNRDIAAKMAMIFTDDIFIVLLLLFIQW